LDGVLSELDLRDATLVGFSMGGGEVARYIGRYGEDRVASVVFAAAVPPYLLKTDDNPDGGLADEDVAGMKEGAASDREGFLDEFTTNFFSADGDLKVTEDQRQEAIKMEKAAGDVALVACIDSFGRTDFRDDLAKITVPTLVLHGDSDATVPFEVSGKRTAATVAGAELVVIGDGPHGCNVSHADEFNRALVDFLGR
ncbi:MAG: alpha/beta hydrolase, partial [Actinomycetota bacterium]|nr:alpha/beta hydrolase [Actinomycetota bacterium]